MDTLYRDAAKMEELEDRGARLGHGEDGADDDGEDRERDHESAARDRAPTDRSRFADPAQDALLQLGLRRPVEVGAEVAQGELEVRHTPPLPFAHAGARGRARAST